MEKRDICFFLRLNRLNANKFLSVYTGCNFCALGGAGIVKLSCLLHSCPESSRFIAEEHRSDESYAKSSKNPRNPSNDEGVVQRDDEGKIQNRNPAWLNRRCLVAARTLWCCRKIDLFFWFSSNLRFIEVDHKSNI